MRFASAHHHLRPHDFAEYPAVFLLIAGLFLIFTTMAVYAYASL